MIVKLNEEEAKRIMKGGNVGYSCEYGAVIGDNDKVVVAERGKYFLVSIDELKMQGFLIMYGNQLIKEIHA